MAAATYTCPRCFRATDAIAGPRFCPRCGLADLKDAAGDDAPVTVVAGGREYQVMDRLSIGSVSAVYRCQTAGGSGGQVEGVFKVARDVRSNALLANEADVLGRLARADVDGRFAPFLPRVEMSLGVGGTTREAARRANVLMHDEQIRSPDELYTLGEVRAAHAGGLGPRHVAWIWRRLLSVLGFAHASGVAHAAVLPEHVLIEPHGHKLVLIDWCCAAPDWRRATGAVAVIGGYRDWYRSERALREPPTPGLDVALGARCMTELLGGDPVGGVFPPSIEPGLRRYFERCTRRPAADAWRLLDDFDRLIEAMWGPRRFVELDMPPKSGGHVARATSP
jgi:hypothetical protein